MRKLLLSLLVFLSLTAVSSAQPDSTVFRALDTRLEEYVSAIQRESSSIKSQECDFLIDSTTDSLVRQHIALKLYNHYLKSPLMGDESVAIHISDTWFDSGKIQMQSDVDLMNARIFADFNRSSLIGCKAPSLVLKTRAGETVNVDFTDAGNRHKVLFFYDSSCSRCKVESILLRNLLSTSDYPVDFYAVYAGDDAQAWEDFVDERLTITSDRVRVHHLWDPELDSDFQRRYGVIQTPRLFLLSPDGTISGRGLDVEALAVMLGNIFRTVNLEYGSDESYELYDSMFSSADTQLKSEDVKSVADHIADITLTKGDTVMFRQMTGDLLYYLAPQTGKEVKLGTGYLIDEYILSRPEVWRTRDDSLKVIGFAMMLDDLLSKSPIGERIPDLTLPGELITSRREHQGEWQLRKLKGRRNIIIFYTEGCDVCDAEKAAARRLLQKEYAGSSARKTKVLLVNVDKIVEERPELAASVFDSFDLSTLPFIIETDRKAVTCGKYLTLLF